MHVEQLVVEELVPLDSSYWVWGHQSSKEFLAFLRSWRMVWDIKIVSRSGFNLVLEVSDVHGVPRRLSEDHLIEADSDGPEISLVSVSYMGASVEELWGHGNWRPKLGSGHIRATLRETEVTNDYTVVVEEDIRQLEISVHNLMLVKFLEPVHDLHEEVDTLLLSQTLVLLNVVLDVSIVTVVNHQVVVVGRFQVFVQVKDVRMLNFTHDSHFRVEKSPQFRILVDFLLGNGLDGEDFIRLLLRGFEDSSELSLSKFAH